MDGWLFLIISLIIGIPFNIFANIATPWVISYFKNHSLSINERRIHILLSRYKAIKKFRKSPNYHKLFRLRMLSWTSLLIIVAFLVLNYDNMIEDFIITNFGYYYGLFVHLFFWGLMLFLQILALRGIMHTVQVDSFEKYKRRTILKLVKLGGRAQDLDNKEIKE